MGNDSTVIKRRNMKQIKLTQGKFAMVDDKLFEELNKKKWHAQKGNSTFYAVRSEYIDGKWNTTGMHRLILGITDKNIFGDHIDHNGLNNQFSNLRACSNIENLRNKKIKEGYSSIYKGVSFHKIWRKWQVRIKGDGKRTHIGYFTDEVEAAKAYDTAAKTLFGEFANLNFKDNSDERLPPERLFNLAKEEGFEYSCSSN